MKVPKPEIAHLEVISDPKELTENEGYKELSQVQVALLAEFTFHSMQVACPFKASQEQKDEYEQNSDYCGQLRKEILRTIPDGTYAIHRNLVLFLVKIDHQAEYKTDQINCEVLHYYKHV